MTIINIKISKEENFLINILFKKRKDFEQEIDLKNIDYELLIKIASAHLMLPSLYVNLTKKGFIDLIPKDLKKYLKHIYSINKKRNQEAINEIKEISEELIKNEINHVFLKGASYLFNNIYDDIGERMMGDIDFLVSKQDFIKTINLFKKSNYKKQQGYAGLTGAIILSVRHGRHYVRIIKKNKLFGLEIHHRLFSKKYNKYLNPELVLKHKIFCNKKIYIPNNQHQLLNNIYNYQINDHGNKKLSYSYRSIYDTFMFIKKNKSIQYKFKLDKYLINYLMILKELGMPIMMFSKLKVKKLNLIRFKFKKSNKLYFNIDNFIINIIINFSIKDQVVEFLINKKYRQYTIKKILNKL